MIKGQPTASSHARDRRDRVGDGAVALVGMAAVELEADEVGAELSDGGFRPRGGVADAIAERLAQRGGPLRRLHVEHVHGDDRPASRFALVPDERDGLRAADRDGFLARASLGLRRPDDDRNHSGAPFFLHVRDRHEFTFL